MFVESAGGKVDVTIIASKEHWIIIKVFREVTLISQGCKDGYDTIQFMFVFNKAD